MISFFVGFAVVAVAFGEVDPKSKCADSGTCSAAPVAPSLLQRAHQTESLVVEEEQTGRAGRAATKRLRLFSDIRAGVELARASPDQARQTARDEFEAMTQGDGEVSEDDLKKAIESRPPNDECFNPQEREVNYTAMIASLDTDSSGSVSTAEFEVYLQTPSFLSAVRNRAFTALSVAACTELTNQAAADADAQSKGQTLRQQAAADFAEADNYTLLPKNAKPSLAASHFRERNKAIENEIVQEVQCSTANAVAAHPEMMTDEEKVLLLDLNASADLDLNASASLLELSSTASPLSALEVAQARLKHAIATAGKDKHDSGRRAGNPAVQTIARFVDEIWKETTAANHFSFLRAASPSWCEGVCQKWDIECHDWVSESTHKCRGWSESSAKECRGGFSDEVTRWCRSWIPDWLGGGCDVYETVSRSVCQGWEWITARTCDGWDWVANGFCKVSSQVCSQFECIFDWNYVAQKLSAPPPLGYSLLEQSKDSVSVDVNGIWKSRGIHAIEDAVAFLTGGGMFAEEVFDNGRFTAFENLREQLENKVTQARDYIQNNNILSPNSISDVLQLFSQGISMPQNLRDAVLGAFNKAAGGEVEGQCKDNHNGQWYCSQWCNTPGKWGCGRASHGAYTCDCTGCNGCQAVAQNVGSSLLQVQGLDWPTFAVHVGASIHLSGALFGYGIQIGIVVGATKGDWTDGGFFEVFSPGNFETDVGVGVSIHLGFWTDFANVAGKAVDFGMNVDLGLIAPALTVGSGGTATLASQATLALHGVRTVPNDSECGKGGWFQAQSKEQNCGDIRWGNYNPPGGKDASVFAAIILSIGLGQSVSPISGDLGASCTSGAWDGGYSHQTNCFDFSEYNIEAKAWRLKAATTQSNWAWTVNQIDFIGRKKGEPFDSTMSIHKGCTPVSSGHYPHYWLDADGPFGGSGVWGGRKQGKAFYIGMKCDEVWDIKKVKLSQVSMHAASTVAIERGKTGDGDWSLVEQVSVPPQGNHLHNIWDK